MELQCSAVDSGLQDEKLTQFKNLIQLPSYLLSQLFKHNITIQCHPGQKELSEDTAWKP